jgi:lipopolysaccharide biosynthesis glycosyltransferase
MENMENMETLPPRARRLVIERIKWFLVNILCAFVPSKKYRVSIREYFLGYRIHLGSPPLPIKKRAQPINLAFGFCRGFARQTGVAIASLLANSQGGCSYNLYCIVDDSVPPDMRDSLAGMVKTQDQESALTFLEANHDFDQALRGSGPLGTYYRLMLPVLLPGLDDIIYADGDVIFCRDLIGVAALELGENLIAGVMEKPGGYINAGFLVLNLARLRQEKTYESWVENSRREHYDFLDQDLLNITCRGRILYLPLKYNFFHCRHYYMAYRRGLILPQDHYDLKYNAVMLHYLGEPKPWNEQTHFLSRLWWEYARLTPFYEDLLAGLKP